METVIQKQGSVEMDGNIEKRAGRTGKFYCFGSIPSEKDYIKYINNIYKKEPLS